MKIKTNFDLKLFTLCCCKDRSIAFHFGWFVVCGNWYISNHSFFFFCEWNCKSWINVVLLFAHEKWHFVFLSSYNDRIIWNLTHSLVYIPWSILINMSISDDLKIEYHSSTRGGREWCSKLHYFPWTYSVKPESAIYVSLLCTFV